ncbi:hypothetical protein [Sphingobacterium deserti]|uniref:Uncharacterized protein n=1 Tax=Sphingobacterium deserti TaxID=1229276 RepID=A0A0B8T0I8_9SPHI|nr:hypothetical protein [Sphingobacterium deserti]KGE14107.1 hypothetical protein DI53_2124 [Sphingobacterium deserti]
MIRPLAYCESINHFEHSIDTIDNRIQELLELRKQYVAGHKALQNVEADESPEFIPENDSIHALNSMITASLHQSR